MLQSARMQYRFTNLMRKDPIRTLVPAARLLTRVSGQIPQGSGYWSAVKHRDDHSGTSAPFFLTLGDRLLPPASRLAHGDSCRCVSFLHEPLSESPAVAKR